MDEQNSSPNELYRSIDHRTISGVCFGFAEYFKVDVTIIRLLFIASLLFSYYTLLIYFAATVIIPKNPNEVDDSSVINTNYTGDKTVLFALAFGGLGLLILWSSVSLPAPIFNFSFPSKLIAGLLLLLISFFFILKRINDPDIDSIGKLYRKRDSKMISGIIAGFAEQFTIDVSVVRLVVIIFCLLEGYIFIFFSLFYLAATFTLPYKDELSTQDS